MESATTTSSPSLSASATAISVLPSAVAPKTATTGGASAIRLVAVSAARRHIQPRVVRVVRRRIALAEPGDREALHAERLFRPYAGLLECDTDLLPDRVYSGQVRQQDAAARPGGDDDPVLRRVQAGEFALLAGAEHVHGADQRFELVFTDGRKARVPQGGRVGVARDLAAQVRLGRFQRADASAQLTVLLEGHEARRAVGVERVFRRRRRAVARHEPANAGARVLCRAGRVRGRPRGEVAHASTAPARLPPSPKRATR